jgi:hypothetical protein
MRLSRTIRSVYKLLRRTAYGLVEQQSKTLVIAGVVLQNEKAGNWFLNLTIALQRFKFMLAQRDRVSLQLAGKFPVHPTRPHCLDMRAAIRSSLFGLQYGTITLMDWFRR